jgi:hypothetical protein
VRLGLALAIVLATASAAHAEDVAAYEVEGQADAGGADSRTAALDEAFAEATTRALAELVPAEARKAHKADLDREIIARARLWVAKFSVAKDATDDGRRQLSVSVRIDRDKIRARLAELNIETGAGTPATATPGAKTVAILLRVAQPSGVVADYGPAADKDAPGVAAVTAALRSGGMTVKRAPTSGSAARAAGDLPLDDDEADALAGEAKADLALVAGISVGDQVAVRGMPGTAALVSAHLRLIERGSHKVIGEGAAAVAVVGEDPAATTQTHDGTGSPRPGSDAEWQRGSIERAVAAAAADLIPSAPPAPHAPPQFHGADTPLPEAGVVLVRLSAKTPYSMVVAEEKYLAGAKGVRSATLHRLSPGGWVIGVATNETVDRVAQMAKKPPATDTSVDVKIADDIVELTLGGAP